MISKKTECWHAIYQITDRENGMSLIGRCREDLISTRLKQHRRGAPSDVRLAERRKELVEKHGDRFDFQKFFDARQIRRCWGTVKDAAIYEKFLAETYGTIWPQGYNTKVFGSGNSTHDEETRRKIGEKSKEAWSDTDKRAQRIKKFKESQSNPALKEKHRQNGKERVFRGQNHATSEEFRQKMRDDNPMHRPEVKANHLKVVQSEEYKENHRKAMNHPGVKAKNLMSHFGLAVNKGKKFSKQACENMSKAKAELKADPERWEQFISKQRESAIKREQRLKADPVKYAEKIRKIKLAQEKLKSDPVRYAEKRRKCKLAAEKGWAKRKAKQYWFPPRESTSSD